MDKVSVYLGLDDEDMRQLSEISRNHHVSRIRRRASALLDIHAGLPASHVASKHAVHVQTVSRWVKTWLEHGLTSVLRHSHGGGPIKLTENLLDTAEEIARTTPMRLPYILRRLREIHPDSPFMTPECLRKGLRRRGIKR